MSDAHLGHRLIFPQMFHKLLTIIRLSELSEQERQPHAVEKVTLDLAAVGCHGLRCQGNVPSDL